ncbi:MAG TPA: serine/threonine protein kinase [Pseudoalteromonas prydzensis]|uniref:non-specific serine/threonine protein kinase n=1 Tax=Pseudoalteromonas prydzensis TaxID=182141 RepID=A0A7V1GDS2_9GAMM|nr:RIO1 family regulatory kinase/ATPase [Pseudoalteromonas prydzensis]HEA15968.1 serine/threonine protein kinase [Pseudoalteromonas prydzensis]
MIEATLLHQLQQQFPDHQFTVNNLKVMHRGRFANAIVYRYTDLQLDLVIKDFQHSPWWVRKTFAPLSVNQEYKGLARLAGITGVSGRFLRLSPLAVAYDYIEGTPLKQLVQQNKVLPVSFFKDFERLVALMHRRGVVHLDLRNLGNVLCSHDGKPYIIDFQSAIRYARFPRWLQRFMRGADMSGVYKAWAKLSEQPLPDAKADYLSNFNHVRKRWIFRGYPIQRAYMWGCGVATQIASAIMERFL